MHGVETHGDVLGSGHEEHDASAVYLPALTTGSVSTGKHLVANLVTLGQLFWLPSPPLADLASAERAATHRELPLRESGCALYLALRALRI